MGSFGPSGFSLTAVLLVRLLLVEGDRSDTEGPLELEGVGAFVDVATVLARPRLGFRVVLVSEGALDTAVEELAVLE